MRCAERCPQTRPSSSDVLASRFAPCRPEQATSPTAYRRPTVGRPVLVDPDAAAGVVRSRHHRQQVARDVDAVLEAAAVHLRELGADALRRHVAGDVEVHVGHAQTQHLGVDAARDHVARREVAPLGVVALHERLAFLVHQPRAGATDGFRDQEARRVAVVERGRVELDVLGVDHARTGAVGHGETVAARAGRVGGAQEDLAEAAGGEQRGAGQAAVDAARALVEHVGADAGQRLVDGAPVATLVGRRQQVDGRVVRQQRGPSGGGASAATILSSIARPVASVACAMRGDGMPALAAERQPPVGDRGRTARRACRSGSTAPAADPRRPACARPARGRGPRRR